jgi:hypothetical protein
VTDLPALLEAINAATERACAQCDGPLDGSPSADFCSQSCQERWHTLRSCELVGYREPLWEWATLGPQPQDFDGEPGTQVLGRTYEQYAGGYVIPGLSRFATTADTHLALGYAEAYVPLWWEICRSLQPRRLSGIRGLQAHGVIRDETFNWSFTSPLLMTDSTTWSAGTVVSDAFLAALRPDTNRTAERHLEVCGECNQRSDVDRHAARLEVEVNDLNQDYALSWPAHSMRGVITEGLPPAEGDRPTALPTEAPSHGPPQRQRAPRVLGRSR